MTGTPDSRGPPLPASGMVASGFLPWNMGISQTGELVSSYFNRDYTAAHARLPSMTTPPRICDNPLSRSRQQELLA